MSGVAKTVGNNCAIPVANVISGKLVHTAAGTEASYWKDKVSSKVDILLVTVTVALATGH